ncbi:hypothetical protein DFS33DRAFT_1434841 [Desarmillaria ectypa]|nr:hypothetical protein DFS33DRAFT_1434841 [Desarmillaria ectypa]
MGYLHRESLAVPSAMSLVKNILKGCQSLTATTYDGFNVDSQLVTALIFVYPPDTYDFSDPEHLPQLAHVRDLSLLLEQFGFEDFAVWNFVLDKSALFRGCQQLLKVPRLQSLRNLCIDVLFPACLVALRSLPHLPPLLRLKLGFAIPLYDASVDELLVALHGFPIHDSVIDGLAEGRPALIENIGQRDPNINSLTLPSAKLPPTNNRSVLLASASVDVRLPLLQLLKMAVIRMEFSSHIRRDRTTKYGNIRGERH